MTICMLTSRCDRLRTEMSLVYLPNIHFSEGLIMGKWRLKIIKKIVMCIFNRFWEQILRTSCLKWSQKRKRRNRKGTYSLVVSLYGVWKDWAKWNQILLPTDFSCSSCFLFYLKCLSEIAKFLKEYCRHEDFFNRTLKAWIWQRLNINLSVN